MTARQDIVWLNLADDVATNRQKVLLRVSSIYSLCQGTLDDMQGVVYLADLLQPSLDEQLARLMELKKELLYLPEQQSRPGTEAVQRSLDAPRHRGQ